MSNCYFITKSRDKANHAGSKAVNDTDNIMLKAGFNKIDIFPSRNKNRFVRKIRNLCSLSRLDEITTGSLVVIEHPLYINKRYIDLVKKIKDSKSLTLAFIIHDFETVRNLFPEDLEIREIEKTVLDIADILIVHNEKMKAMFVERFGLASSRIISLSIFDYLCDGDIRRDRTASNEITIAGNLNPQKSGYIYKLEKQCKDLTFILYGVNYEQSGERENIKYLGSVDSEILPNVLEGGFGLIWDGDSIESCTGSTGEYMKINNPHKASLYLASGVPVIVWKEAAISDFVIENKVGICVSSLNEISETINRLSEEEYNEMLDNARTIGARIRSGYYFSEALNKAKEYYYKNSDDKVAVL